MSDVIAARDAYLNAREQVKAARLALGRAIHEARQRNVAQADIAKQLGLTREHIRVYEVDYKKAAAGA